MYALQYSYKYLDDWGDIGGVVVILVWYLWCSSVLVTVVCRFVFLSSFPVNNSNHVSR